MTVSDPEAPVTVLVVDDEILLRLFAADFLEDAGFKVVEAKNADEAVTLLHTCPEVQAVVTDVEMPGSMNGFKLARMVRQYWPGIGVIVTSGRAVPTPGDLPEDIAFLTKPYRPLTVINLIRRMAILQLAPSRSAAIR